MKNYIKSIIFLTILILIILVLNKLFSPVGTYEASWYSSTAMLDIYKQEENTIDVLYVGDSNIYTGVSPFEIYESIGVTGFAASTPMQDVIGSYYIIKEFFKKQSPSIVMIETTEFFTKKENFAELGMRSEIDFMKLSKNKLDAINDKDFNFSNDEKLMYLFPIIKFHTRYKKLTEFDIRKFISKSEVSYKGYLYDKNIKENKKKNMKEFKELYLAEQSVKSNELQVQNYVDEKIDLIKEFCEKNNSELVLISMPTTDEMNLEKYNVLKEYSESKELKYINLNFEMDNPIDWENDTQDGGNHLNIYGAKKVGKYISNFIKENFKIESKKENEKYNLWNQELEGYIQKKESDSVN